MVFIIGYSYALRSSWPLPKCHSNEIYNKNINSVTEMGGGDNRRVFSSYGIPWVVIQRVQYLGKYVFIIDAKWSEPIKGYNIKDGQYFLK